MVSVSAVMMMRESRVGLGYVEAAVEYLRRAIEN
jgi:hypothetical protein